MKNSNLSKPAILILILCAIGFVITVFSPVWAIYLQAPQYPEGLAMFIHADKIAGEVDIINGLNHYIGMKEIKQDEFWEFKILPITLWVFAAVCVLVALLRKKIGLYAFTIFYLIFGVAFMYDFWKWEYDYGHNLDPNAAIVVPGMSYQPPLFGSKQLLNFVAHSYPDVGGWILISAGALLLIACFIEFRKPKNKLN